MPFLTSTESTVLTVRASQELADRVQDFVHESDLSRSAALRVLIERGLDSGIDIDHLRSISYTAKAAALDELEQALADMVNRFFR